MRLIPVGALRENQWNPNTLPEHTMRALVANVKRAGFTQPILVRPDGDVFEVIDGAHRLRAAVEAGLKDVPCVVVHLPDHEAKAQTLAMNKLRGQAEPAGEAAIVLDLEDSGLDLTELADFTGYTMEELIDLHNLAGFEWAPPESPKRERTAAARTGEAWVTLSYRVPESVAHVIRDELDRLLRLLGGDATEAMCLECMALNSANTPDRNVLGE